MDNKQQLVADVVTSLRRLEPDVAKRNEYMNTRDNYVYGSSLWDGLDIEGWFAEYNYLLRVIDVHTAQLMGRPYNVYSYYDKEDLKPYEGNPEEMQLAVLRNRKRKASADTRKKVLDAVRRDNGGDAIYKEGARIGSLYGQTVYKQWGDFKAKKVKRVLVESPQNMYHGWSDDNFRERDFDAFVYQISEDAAYRLYGDKLPDADLFETSKEGSPFTTGSVSNANTADPLNQLSTPANNKGQETERPMVTVIDFVGYLKGWGADGKDSAKKVTRGKENRLQAMLVGGHLVSVETREQYIPKYYLIQNRVRPRRAHGESDLAQSALDINREIVQLEADSRRWMEKNLYNLIEAKGFTAENIPKKKPRKQQVVAMAPEQSLSEMSISTAPMGELRNLIDQKLQAFVRVAQIGRVLFDDPVDANSNQALLTTMKPVIDIVEDKQSRWEPMLLEMDTDALSLSALMVPSLKDAVSTDENWFLCIEWPSVLRREDSSFQSMWQNRIAAGTISLETYMEKMGDDYSEEMDRLTDEMQDKIPAAVMGRALPAIAGQLITPPVPESPNVRYNVNVNAKTDADPTLNESVVEEVLGGDKGGQVVDNMVNQPQPGQAPSPIINPDQNTDTTMPVSQPGTGQPPVSPEGAVAQAQQNEGA